MDTIEQRFKNIIVEALCIDPERVVDKANLIDDLGADSLDEVEILMAVEQEFGVEITDDQAETIQTVGDAMAWLKKNVPA